MGVVIEICIKYFGGPTRNTGADMHSTGKLSGYGKRGHNDIQAFLVWYGAVYYV
jgi:hypothetical protein